jgi:hypothetical protein
MGSLGLEAGIPKSIYAIIGNFSILHWGCSFANNGEKGGMKFLSPPCSFRPEVEFRLSIRGSGRNMLVSGAGIRSQKPPGRLEKGKVLGQSRQLCPLRRRDCWLRRLQTLLVVRSGDRPGESQDPNS